MKKGNRTEATFFGLLIQKLSGLCMRASCPFVSASSSPSMKPYSLYSSRRLSLAGVLWHVCQLHISFCRAFSPVLQGSFGMHA